MKFNERYQQIHDAFMKGGVTKSALGRKFDRSPTHISVAIASHKRYLAAQEKGGFFTLSERSQNCIKNMLMDVFRETGVGFERACNAQKHAISDPELLRKLITTERLRECLNLGRVSCREIEDVLGIPSPYGASND